MHLDVQDVETGKSNECSGQKKKKKVNDPEGAKYFSPVERGKYNLGKKNCLTITVKHFILVNLNFCEIVIFSNFLIYF